MWRAILTPRVFTTVSDPEAKKEAQTVGKGSAAPHSYYIQALYLWRIHFNIWQNQYNIVKFKKKKKE